MATLTTTIDGWSPPETFDGFELRGAIGRGGMGRVFLAHDSALDRPVAIKFITAAAPGRAARERFLIEARAIARLQHPNVVSIYRIGEVDGRPYLASEYVDGKSLDQLEKPVPWGGALDIATAVARGLAAAHARGVLHRDVKPANVIQALDGTVKLLDFGLAKLDETASEAPSASPASPPEPGAELVTRESPSEVPWGSPAVTLPVRDADDAISQTMPAAELYRRVPEPRTVTGALIGTPLFLAPELWSGERATPRSDVYAAGLLVYELCAGELPFASHAGAELVRHVREVGLPPLATVRPDVPRTFASVVDRAVSRAPGDRFASAAELLEALEAEHSVFQSFRKVASGGPEDDAALVATSFRRVGAHVDSLFVAVYERLFAEDPSLRALFPSDLTEQRAKLAATIRLSVDGLRSPERLVPILQELGHRHVGYGIAPRHLQVLGRHLLSSMADFDAAGWDERTQLAWERAYAALAGAMERGMSPALRSA